jgi:hypothetical protein
MAVFPLFYAGNIAYYRALLSAEEIQFERHEHFPKQTYRNRIEILGPNGLQKLVIPTVKTGAKRTMENVAISYVENWQKDHWKSLEAAYRRSPYFEFYEGQLIPFYRSREMTTLWEFNLGLFDRLNTLLGLELQYEETSSYAEQPTIDHRIETFQSDDHLEPYIQVFEDRHPFHPNLSIFDALFNLGPQAKALLIK